VADEAAGNGQAVLLCGSFEIAPGGAAATNARMFSPAATALGTLSYFSYIPECGRPRLWFADHRWRMFWSVIWKLL
jgi:hypothetical protein